VCDNSGNRAEKRILVDRIIAEFERGIVLLDALNDKIYTKTSYGVGSIGSHFRHNLDFANGLLNGLKSGRIDYNNRERDLKVEQNLIHAKERFLFLIQTLSSISSSDFEKTVHVRSEIDEGSWHKSSIARELEFLHSHTVHHFALIAEKLHTLGIEVSSDFGVAPSTLKYWSERDSKNRAA